MNFRFCARSAAVRRCSAHSCRATQKLGVMLLALGAALPFAAFAHEGEDHGAPASPMTPAPGETRLAASGSGALFEAILKYRPFGPGEPVEVVAYLLSLETNRPVSHATVSASLSEGDQSATVAFAPKPGGPVGAYHAVVTPKTAAPMSWLFDVTADGNSDLIAITGFRARSPESGPGVEGVARAGQSSAATPQSVLGMGVIGALGLVVAFIAGRLTARKAVSA